MTIARIQVKHTWVLKEWNMSSMYFRVMTITQKRRRKPMLIAIPPRFERKNFSKWSMKKKRKKNAQIFVDHLPYLTHSSNVHLSLTSKCSDISTMTAIAPNSEHSHMVLKSSVSFSLKKREVKITRSIFYFTKIHMWFWIRFFVTWKSEDLFDDAVVHRLREPIWFMFR